MNFKVLLSLIFVICIACIGTHVQAITKSCETENESDTVEELMTNIVLEKCIKYVKEHQGLSNNVTLSGKNICTAKIGTFERPADSCEQVAKLETHSVPGYNWIKNSTEDPTLVYCTATTEWNQNDFGWARIAFLDMTDPHQTCPQGFRQINSPKRACGRTISGRGGCNSMTFHTKGLRYNKVCGRVIGYHFGSPSAFYSSRVSPSIDGYYLEGVSITRGRNPRKHIWSLANALQDVAGGNVHVCPCTVPGQSTYTVPSFVGNDYFCDTGSLNWGQVGTLYTNDPLWDGHGCEAESECCTFNNPPWFCKQLPTSTTDDIEVRICADEGWENEDSPIELMELYIK